MATEKRLVYTSKVLEKADEVTFMGFRAEERKQHFMDLVSEILKVPTADAVEVVHGRWIHTENEDDDWGSTWHKWTCSNCDYSTGHNPHGTNYCPNCGSKMDGDGNG